MNNAKYYAGNVVKTSAHYFVDANEIVQSVDDLRVAWAVGGKKYPSCPQTGGGTLHGRCLNANSISIELCDAKKDGVYAPSAKAVAQALELTKALMKKYNIPASNVIRHFDVTGKLCPAYWSGKENAGKWEKEFHGKLTAPDYRAQLQKRAGLTDGTMDYLSAYQYGDDLVRKLATMK
nr:MAG TPA: N-acetylmuramoyl-L-alanine amidase [Bacteriophage sp.]